MTTYGDFFSGGGGMTIGAKQAGYNVLFGVEYDEQIADVYRRNLGDHVIVQDVTKLDMATLPRVDVFHASPPCTNASVANANGGESPFDMAMAQAVCRYIVAKLPDVVTLENVYGYRNFESWHDIARTLLANGYTYKFWHINMADYGTIELCPIHHVLECTRKNVHGAEMYLNQDSKKKTAPDIVQQSAKMPTDAQAKILAWDVAVALVQVAGRDIVENATLPKMAQNLRKIKQVNKTTIGKVEKLLMSVGMSELEGEGSILENIALLLSVCLEENLLNQRLFTTSTEIQKITALKILKFMITIPSILATITQVQENRIIGDLERNGSNCPLCQLKGVPQTRKRMIVVARRDGIQPSIPDATHAKDPQPSFFGTLPRWVSWHEAIEDILHTLPDSQFAKWQLERLPDELRESLVVNPNDQNFGNPISEKNNPLFTVRIAGGSFFPRALLIEPSNASVGSDRAQNEPAQAVTTPTGGRSYRAFIVDGGNANSFAPRQQDEPARTIGDTERVGNIQRAAINGRVVKMTPRAIARFQSFPDWYELPERASLAVKVLGNAVPPLFAEKLYKHIGGTP